MCNRLVMALFGLFLFRLSNRPEILYMDSTVVFPMLVTASPAVKATASLKSKRNE